MRARASTETSGRARRRAPPSPEATDDAESNACAIGVATPKRLELKGLRTAARLIVVKIGTARFKSVGLTAGTNGAQVSSGTEKIGR